MANGDWHTEYMWGAVLLFFVGIYGWVGKHLWGHVTRDEVAKLKDTVQYKDNCTEIVKRLDASAEQTHEMLERVLNKLDRMNGSQ